MQKENREFLSGFFEDTSTDKSKMKSLAARISAANLRPRQVGPWDNIIEISVYWSMISGYWVWIKGWHISMNLDVKSTTRTKQGDESNPFPVLEPLPNRYSKKREMLYNKWIITYERDWVVLLGVEEEEEGDSDGELSRHEDAGQSPQLTPRHHSSPPVEY